MKKRQKTVLVSILMLSLILLLSGVGLAESNVEKDMPKEFVIPYCGALSGPYAPQTYPNYLGIVDFVDWYNKEKGGLFGKVPIKVMARDFGTELSKALEAYEEFRSMEPKPPFIYMAFSNAQEALAERYAEDKIVGFGSPAPTAVYHIFPGTWTIAWCPSYADSAGFFIKWLAETWVPKTGTKAKLAFLTWDNAMGRAIMIDAVRDYAKKMGVEIVAEEVYDLKAMDVTAQLGKIKKAGANWVFGNALGHGPAVVAKSAEALGINNHDLFDTTPGKLHLAGGPWSGCEAPAKLAPQAMVGWISCPPIPAWTDDVPSMKIIRDIFKKNKREAKYEGLPYSAFSMVIPWTLYLVEETVKDVGWKNLNGETYRKHLMKLKNHAVMGDSKFGVITVTEERPGPFLVTLWQVGKDGVPRSIVPYGEAPDLHPKLKK